MDETPTERIERITQEDRERLGYAIRQFLESRSPEDAFPNLNESIGVEGMGVKVGATGTKTPLAVLVILGASVMAGIPTYFIIAHERANVDRAAAVIAASKEIAAKQVEVREGMAEIVYVLTLDEKDRKALRMDMPDSLRRGRTR